MRQKKVKMGCSPKKILINSVLFILFCILSEIHTTISAVFSTDTAASTAAADHVGVTNHEKLPPFKKMPNSIKSAVEEILSARQMEIGTDAAKAGGRVLPRATFIQIGANDGTTNDPLYKPMLPDRLQWIGILVEPTPALFETVVELHKEDAPEWTFYNGAMGNSKDCVNGTVSFCETLTPGVGDWKTQGQINKIVPGRCNPENSHIVQRPCLSSFDQLIQQHASPAFLRHTTTGSSISTITTIVNRRNENRRYHVDLLQIDVEGRDFEVIQLIDFERLDPHCIHYESWHLNDKEPVARAFLEAQGYTVKKVHAMDTLACRVLKKKDKVQPNA